MKQKQIHQLSFSSVVKQIKLLLGFGFVTILFAALLVLTTGKVPQKVNTDSSNHFFSAKVPIGNANNLPELLMEEESSEEDELYHGHTIISTCSKYGFSFHELNYSSLVNNRFSHLLSVLHQKAEAPYFLLYKSWKSDLV